jgi:hypothetical protein
MRRLAIAIIAAAATLAACGEDKLTAQEFVERMDENGAPMELGKELFTDQEGKELFEVELPTPSELAAAEEEHGGEGHDHGSTGTVAVLEDSDAAEDETARCKRSADLLCFQAGNIALLVDAAADSAVIVRLSKAIEGLAE